MTVRWAAVVLLMILPAAGCVKRVAAGSPGIQPQVAKQPDGSFRSILQQQTQGAFDPLNDDRRVQTLQARLKLNSQDLPVRLELASIYEAYGLYDDGQEQYAEALRQASTPGADRAIAEQAVAGLGRCAKRSGLAAEAIPLLEAFLKEQPSASSWNELGLLQDQVGNLAAGEAAFRAAVVLDSKSDRLHNNLGYNLMLQNKSEAAEGELRTALELNAKSATSRNNLGVVLARRSDLAGALQQFQLAGDAAAAHNNLAVVLLEMGQYEQSRAELVKALSIRQYFAPALENFKLVQERIRERAELKSGDLPVSTVQEDAQSKRP